jgi:hypothetical protein
VRDATGDEEDELAAVTTRDAGAASAVETFGMMRLADELDDELADEDGSSLTDLDAGSARSAGFAAAFGAGFLSFAMICLVLPRLG